MATFDDDDDDFRSGDRRSNRGGADKRDDSWDRDSPEEAELTPDDMNTIRCSNCKKFIFEDVVRCPYCKCLQLEAEHNKKPLWIVVAAILCILGFAFWILLGVLDILSYFHR